MSDGRRSSTTVKESLPTKCRVRRQAEFDNSQRVVTHEVVNDVVTGMAYVRTDHNDNGLFVQMIK